MGAVQTEPDGRAPTRMNMCYQQCLPSFTPWLVRFFPEYQSLVVKACESTTSTERGQAPDFLTVRYVSTSTALLQLMLLTFKPFY